MRILFLILFSFMLVQQTNAESWLIINSETKEVISLSNEDDAQLQAGWEKIILDEDFSDIVLARHPVYYKYIDKKFITNNDKLDAEYQLKLVAEEAKEEEDMIYQKARALAIDELVKEGKSFKHWKTDGSKK